MKSKMHTGAAKPLYQMAGELRNNSTYAETILRGYFKTKPLDLKFRQQHLYSIYILDFYCHNLKLVIDADGCIHKINEVLLNDKIRQDHLEKDGLTILRFENKKIEIRVEEVTKEIEDSIIKTKDEQKR